MLRIRNLQVYYGRFMALDRVSFSIEKGEIVSFIGANGAGKSTVLKAVSGLCEDVVGEMMFENRDILKLPPHERVKRGIVHIPEGRRLFPKLTVFENLRLGAYTSQAQKHFKKSLQMVFDLFPRMAERKNQLAGSLSGGEQQMCAIGRGLMAVPRFLMLDEPSLGLAPLLVANVYEAIRQINKEGITVLLVEQNSKMSLKYAKRFYVLEGGKIVHEQKGGNIDDLLLRRRYFGIM